MRKTNYQLEKRNRDLRKKKEKEEKLKKRQAKRAADAAAPATGVGENEEGPSTEGAAETT